MRCRIARSLTPAVTAAMRSAGVAFRLSKTFRTPSMRTFRNSSESPLACSGLFASDGKIDLLARSGKRAIKMLAADALGNLLDGFQIPQ